ncbi:hypothetical protein B0H13DRAFT_2307267 [Mycena leptocephala]|nr:hypothetical protein B0H13DRAFT_2307267 [Mycena leptocephala]
MSYTFFPLTIIPPRSPFLPPDARLRLELLPTPVIFSESRFHPPYNVISAHKTLVCCASNLNAGIPPRLQNVLWRPSNSCTTARAMRQDWPVYACILRRQQIQDRAILAARADIDAILEFLKDDFVAAWGHQVSPRNQIRRARAKARARRDAFEEAGRRAREAAEAREAANLPPWPAPGWGEGGGWGDAGTWGDNEVGDGASSGSSVWDNGWNGWDTNNGGAGWNLGSTWGTLGGGGLANWGAPPAPATHRRLRVLPNGRHMRRTIAWRAIKRCHCRPTPMQTLERLAKVVRRIVAAGIRETRRAHRAARLQSRSPAPHII